MQIYIQPKSINQEQNSAQKFCKKNDEVGQEEVQNQNQDCPAKSMTATVGVYANSQRSSLKSVHHCVINYMYII